MLKQAEEVTEGTRTSHWGLYSRMLRCPKHRMCAICRDDAKAKPHGPHYRMVRSRPDIWPKKDEVHLGRLVEAQVRVLTESLPYFDKKYPERKPSKGVVLSRVERLLAKEAE